jgi:hypothetical protein
MQVNVSGNRAGYGDFEPIHDHSQRVRAFPKSLPPIDSASTEAHSSSETFCRALDTVTTPATSLGPRMSSSTQEFDESDLLSDISAAAPKRSTVSHKSASMRSRRYSSEAGSESTLKRVPKPVESSMFRSGHDLLTFLDKLKEADLQHERKGSDCQESCAESIAVLVNFTLSPLPTEGTYDEDILLPDKGFFSPRSQLGSDQSASSSRAEKTITEGSIHDRFESVDRVTECRDANEPIFAEAGVHSPQLQCSSKGYSGEDIGKGYATASPSPPLQPTSPKRSQSARADRFLPRVNGTHDGYSDQRNGCPSTEEDTSPSIRGADQRW